MGVPPIASLTSSQTFSARPSGGTRAPLKMAEPPDLPRTLLTISASLRQTIADELHVFPGRPLVRRIPQQEGRMVGNPNRYARHFMPAPTQAAQRVPRLQQLLGGDSTEGDDHPRAMSSTCRSRNERQAAASSGCGSRLFGGRHLTTFVM